MYAKKYKTFILDLPLDTSESLKSHEYGIERNDKFLGLRYYFVDEATSKKLLDTLVHPEQRSHFKVYLMVINTPYVLPHSDNDISVVINYYVKTAGAMTVFWETKVKKDVPIYTEDELTPVESFKAEPNEAWILDITQIHSVVCSENDDPLRMAYCLQSVDLKLVDIK